MTDAAALVMFFVTIACAVVFGVGVGASAQERFDREDHKRKRGS